MLFNVKLFYFAPFQLLTCHPTLVPVRDTSANNDMGQESRKYEFSEDLV